MSSCFLHSLVLHSHLGKYVGNGSFFCPGDKILACSQCNWWWWDGVCAAHCLWVTQPCTASLLLAWLAGLCALSCDMWAPNCTAVAHPANHLLRFPGGVKSYRPYFRAKGAGDFSVCCSKPLQSHIRTAGLEFKFVLWKWSQDIFPTNRNLLI